MDKLSFVRERYFQKFEQVDDFDHYYELYQKLPTFRANENIHEILTDYKNRNELEDKEAEFVNNSNELDPKIH